MPPTRHPCRCHRALCTLGQRAHRLGEETEKDPYHANEDHRKARVGNTPCQTKQTLKQKAQKTRGGHYMHPIQEHPNT